MTVGELISSLWRFPADATLFFEPHIITCGGFPRFMDARPRDETRFDDDDKEIPTGRVLVVLLDEVEE
jgi:hypothetical protein